MGNKFEVFQILSKDYKVVKGHGIMVNILVPKGIAAGKHPVIVRFHGGGYVTGDSLFHDWFPIWQAELAVSKAAIVVTPNYRLLPEANGLDIMEDIEDFWKWLNTHLVDTVKEAFPEVTPDTSRIMTAGESAGGYLSVQLAMNHPEQINSCIAEFPSLDLESDEFAKAKETPKVPKEVIESYLATMNADAVVSSSPNAWDRFPLILSMTENGVFLPRFGYDSSLYPMQRLQRGEKLPPLFIIHGEDDEVVPVQGSKDFAKLLQEKQPQAKFILSTVPGPHGLHETWHTDHPAMKEGLDLVVSAWLA